MVRRAGWEHERRATADEMRVQLRLPGDAGHRLRTIAAATQLTPEQVLTQLARHAELHTNGTLTAPPFTRPAPPTSTANSAKPCCPLSAKGAGSVVRGCEDRRRRLCTGWENGWGRSRPSTSGPRTARPSCPSGRGARCSRDVGSVPLPLPTMQYLSRSSAHAKTRCAGYQCGGGQPAPFALSFWWGSLPMLPRANMVSHGAARSRGPPAPWRDRVTSRATDLGEQP
jgi:hypothetical protein